MRVSKASQPRLYLADPSASTEQRIEPDAVALEFMMNARLVDGVDWALFEHRTGLTKSDLAAQWSQLQTNELVATTHCGTTKKGLRYLDSICRRLFRGLLIFVNQIANGVAKSFASGFKFRGTTNDRSFFIGLSHLILNQFKRFDCRETAQPSIPHRVPNRWQA